jgi:hypothetical protein
LNGERKREIQALKVKWLFGDRSVRVYYIAMGKPMRGVVTDDGSPLTPYERFVLNHETHDSTPAFECPHS